MNKRKKNFIIFGVFSIFILVSYLVSFELGKKVGYNFYIFAKDMVLILPPAFIVIGLFDVWISRETVEKSVGEKSGVLKYVYAILLASTTVGGTFVAFPLGNSLYHKGASFDTIITYITAASLFMIPMSLMEASILGPKFTLLRLGTSIPLIILSAKAIEFYLKKINYEFPIVE